MPKAKPKAQIGEAGSGKTGSEEQRIRFDYIKSNAFRVIHVDGAWGGLRPDLTFHLSLYSERYAIPKSLTIDLDSKKVEAGKEVVAVESRESVIREVEVCAVMDLATAQSLRDWLDDHIHKAEERLAHLTSGQENQDEEAN